MLLLTILLIVAIIVALFYRSKAKEFESLFELSKDYGIVASPSSVWTKQPTPKLNKDGSIAKKRGRKAKNV